MSFEAKTVFINRLKSRLADILTGAQEDQVLSVLSECLSNFDVEQLAEESSGSDDLLQTYLSTLEIQGRSEKTIARYGYLIQRMLDVVKIATSDITVFHLRSYLSKEKGRGVSSETLEGIRQVFSAYFNWLHREGLIKQNPTANLGPIKRQKKVKTIYTDIDIEKLKQHCSNLRDKAIVCFLYSTGCRISELTQLNIDDVDMLHLEAKVLGKGNKERTVYLDAVSAMILEQYLRKRDDDEDALFVSLLKPHKRIQPGGIRNMLIELGKKADVEHVHPHKFRRTRATKLVKHGMPIQEVAAVLGHEKLDTTMKYVVMDKSDIKLAFQKCV